jgi:CHAT domain-containing protein/tetratricopeptide (TPR) repeat protein
MSSRGNLHRLIPGLVGGLALLGLAGVLVWRRGPERSSATPAKRGGEVLESTKEREIHFLNEKPVPLVPGQPIQAELKGGEGYRYALALDEGSFARVVVEQKGVDAAVLVYRPEQEKPGRVDSPNGSEGPEIVFLLAQRAGSHRLEVVCEDPSSSSGRYEIRFEDLRQAKPEDRAFYEAWKLFRRGESQRQGGQLREALGFYAEALPAWRKLGHRDWEAETLHRIGWVERDVGHSPEALAALQAALPWFQHHGPRVQEGEILNMISRLLLAQGDTEQALAHGEGARALFQELGKPGLEAEALHSLGDIWFRRGETDKALALFTRSRDLARLSGDSESRSLPLHGLGEVYLYLGQFGSSQDSFQEALQEEKRAGNVRNQAQTLRALADLHLRRKDVAAAGARLDEALAMERARNDRDGEAVLLNSLGVLALEEGKPGEARTSFENALALARATGNRYSEAFTLLNLGRALFDAKDVEGALRIHEQAVGLFEQLDHRRGLVSTLYGSARALNALGRFREAEQRLQQVGDDTELLRGGAQSPGLRSTFFATKQHYFDLYVDVLMNLHGEQPFAGHDHRALVVNERRRARSLLEELGGRTQIRSDADPKLAARRRDLEESIEATEQELLASSGQAGEDERSRPQEKRLRSLLAELDRVRTASREEHARSGLSEPRPLSFKGMQELLDANTLLIIFSLGDERSYLWCVANHGRIESRVLPGRAWFEERAGLLSRIWSQKKRGGGHAAHAGRLARELSEELLGGVAHLLGSRRLILVPDGGLQRLSFAALPDPQALHQKLDPVPPLLARHEIAYLPSASVLAASRRAFQKRASAPGRLIVLADPVFDGSDPRMETESAVPPAAEDPSLSRAMQDLGIEPFRRLPFSGQEAAAVSGLFPQGASRVLAGFDADLDAVEKGALKPYAIVHFATHALVHPEHPELSGLVLSQIGSDGSPRQGYLRAYRIADLDLRADLAVLSACETGVGTDLRGEGAQALTRSFLRAGVPRLVVSLWPVSDAGTAVLMERFYRGMIEHRLPPPQALRCAQLSMLRDKRWNDPFFWAPFVFQGEWEKRVAKPPSDDPIERQSGGGSLVPVPDDGFPPPPPTERPPSCPDLTGGKPAGRRSS